MVKFQRFIKSNICKISKHEKHFLYGSQNLGEFWHIYEAIGMLVCTIRFDREWPWKVKFKVNQISKPYVS